MAPILAFGGFPSFLSHYFSKEKPKPPPISTTAASLLLVLYTVIYVLPFYLSSTTRPSATLSRDAPTVIRARIRAVSLACIICSVSTFLLLTSKGEVATADALHSMGYWPLGLPETVKALLLTAILFLGPLYETFIVNQAWRGWVKLQPLHDLLGEWTTWRNVVAGPVTEEILFRSASVPLMLLSQTSVTKTIFLSPVIFGLAHLHHFYEFRLTHPQVPVRAAVLRSVLQLCYTSLFGAYEIFVFLRTGSLLAIVMVHAFCNCMGLPRFWGRLEPVESAESLGNSEKRKPSVAWSVVYYSLLIVGAGLWWRELGPLTLSVDELVPVSI